MNDAERMMQKLAKMMSNPDPEAGFNEMFADQIKEASKGPQMPDTIVIEYNDGTKDTLRTKK